MLQVVTIPIKLGGSGRGISYYSTAARCPRRAKLDATLTGASAGHDAAVGTIGHGGLELFYKGELDWETATSTDTTWMVDEPFMDAMPEAIRLMRAYLRRFPERDFWGEVVGAEVSLPEEAKASFVKAFFMVDLTARLDLVVRVKEEHLTRILDRTGLQLTPGIYIIDHKFKTRRDNNLIETYTLSAQFTAYPPLWDLHHPAEPCQGMIANVIVGNKEPAFQQALVQPPDETRLTGLRNWLIAAEALAGTDFPNWTSCKDFNRVCGHYSSGLCNRT